MVTFNVPWVETSSGVALQESTQPITLSADGARCILFGVYQNGFPVIIGQSQDGHNTINLVLKRAGKSLKGKATLKITAYDQSWASYGFQKDFNII